MYMCAELELFHNYCFAVARAVKQSLNINWQGVGLSVHGPFWMAFENTLFAMPETFIGKFNHCGGLLDVRRIYQPGEDKYSTKPLSPTTLYDQQHWKSIVQCIRY